MLRKQMAAPKVAHSLNRSNFELRKEAPKPTTLMRILKVITHFVSNFLKPKNDSFYLSGIDKRTDQEVLRDFEHPQVPHPETKQSTKPFPIKPAEERKLVQDIFNMNKSIPVLSTTEIKTTLRKNSNQTCNPARVSCQKSKPLAQADINEKNKKAHSEIASKQRKFLAKQKGLAKNNKSKTILSSKRNTM